LKPEAIVSVVIVNWNGQHHLAECLDGLGEQTFKHFETILIDNGSTDGSVSWVQEHFPWVRVVALSENTGFCHANNLGYAVSEGGFIALLNNDTSVERDWLVHLYNEMQKDVQIGISVSRIVRYDNPTILDAAGDGYDLSGVGFRRGHGEPADYYERSEEVFGACAAAALYRKSMLEDIGFLDEDFFAIGEDVDLSFRAKMADYRCVYVPKAVVRHKISETVGVESDFQIYQSRRNVEYVYFQNMPFVLLLFTLPMHLLYNLLTFGQAVWRGKLSTFLRAKWDFLTHFKKVYKKRRRIQLQRKISLNKLLSFFSRNYLLKRSMSEVVDRP
jgi:GT2 family glycosyltransferase